MTQTPFSQDKLNHHVPPAPDDHPQPEGSHAASHGSLKSYLIGFVASVILTAIPFWLVMTGQLASAQATGLTIMAFAVVQIIVHIFCFLHVDAKAEGGWTMMALIFTLVMVVIVLSGSLWVMYNLNSNMMPPMVGHDMSTMP
jgi:cytochrome o ubiquinol oxidase operon protein cyoD